jgi:hypothetical protein
VATLPYNISEEDISPTISGKFTLLLVLPQWKSAVSVENIHNGRQAWKGLILELAN